MRRHSMKETSCSHDRDIGNSVDSNIPASPRERHREGRQLERSARPKLRRSKSVGQCSPARHPKNHETFGNTDLATKNKTSNSLSKSIVEDEGNVEQLVVPQLPLTSKQPKQNVNDKRKMSTLKRSVSLRVLPTVKKELIHLPNTPQKSNDDMSLMHKLHRIKETKSK